MNCQCEKPVENINPRNAGACVKCGHFLDPEWTSSDANLGAFFEQLAEATFPAYGKTLDRKLIPTWFFHLYRECSSREKAGRKKFGLNYLTADNVSESMEEAADLINYAYMETLRRKRDGEDTKEHLALTAALHAARAFEVARGMRLGVPHPISESDN